MRQMYLSLKTVKTERSGVLNNFEHIPHNCSSVSIADFEQVNISRARGDTFARCYNKLRQSLDSTKICSEIPFKKTCIT